MRKGMLLVLLTSTLAFFVSSPSASALDKVRIGVAAMSPTNSAVWITKEHGLFKKHGLEAEVIYIAGGAQRHFCRDWKTNTLPAAGQAWLQLGVRPVRRDIKAPARFAVTR